MKRDPLALIFVLATDYALMIECQHALGISSDLAETKIMAGWNGI